MLVQALVWSSPWGFYGAAVRHPRGGGLTSVAPDGATGIRLCAWRHRGSVNITVPATKALRR